MFWRCCEYSKEMSLSNSSAHGVSKERPGAASMKTALQFSHLANNQPSLRLYILETWNTLQCIHFSHFLTLVSSKSVNPPQGFLELPPTLPPPQQCCSYNGSRKTFCHPQDQVTPVDSPDFLSSYHTKSDLDTRPCHSLMVTIGVFLLHQEVICLHDYLCISGWTGQWADVWPHGIPPASPIVLQPRSPEVPWRYQHSACLKVFIYTMYPACNILFLFVTWLLLSLPSGV